MTDLKNTLRGAEDATRRALARVRTWFEPPLDGDARPLEVREAIIDHVEERAEPTAGGRRTLPYNHVIAWLLAETPEARAALEAACADLGDAVRRRLAEIRCAVPNGFEVELQFLRRPRAGWRPDQRYAVEYGSRPVTRAPASRQAPPPPLRLTVVRGQTSEPEYVLSQPEVRIGRTPDPVDHLGRPRHNHVVFAEDGDDHSRTVGRAHASIQYDAARQEYRLFDDGSHNGTRVVRGGTSINVAPRNPVGVTILSGDELQFGTAAVRVDL
jgi:hypothetical protein